MRYPASEKLEIIRLVEQSHLPARRALQQIAVGVIMVLAVGLDILRRRFFIEGAGRTSEVAEASQAPKQE